jgi:hypothetical protein
MGFEKLVLSDAASKVMSAVYKGVLGWAEVFQAVQVKAYEELQPTTSEVIHAELAFVASSQDLKTPGRKGLSMESNVSTTIHLSPFLFCSNRNLKTPVMTRTLHLPKPYDSRPTPHTVMQPRISDQEDVTQWNE